MSTTSDGDKVTVVAVISAEESDSTNGYSKYKVTYQVGYENDQLKLISGKGKEI